MAALLLTVANAQEPNNSKPEQLATSGVTPKVINVWPGVAPGSEQWKQKETTLRFRSDAEDRQRDDPDSDSLSARPSEGDRLGVCSERRICNCISDLLSITYLKRQIL